jgi:hypothetical protein
MPAATLVLPAHRPAELPRQRLKTVTYKPTSVQRENEGAGQGVIIFPHSFLLNELFIQGRMMHL